MAPQIDVFADLLCPFAHVGIRRVLEQRDVSRASEPLLRIWAWPLEMINATRWDTAFLGREIEALRASVAPELFTGFNPETFPDSSLPGFAVVNAAYRKGLRVGESVSIELRNRLWESGENIADPRVLKAICDAYGVEVVDDDMQAATHDRSVGSARGVIGSPHFFVGDDGFFCPAFQVSHDDRGFHITPDHERFEAFVRSALAQEESVVADRSS